MSPIGPQPTTQTTSPATQPRSANGVHGHRRRLHQCRLVVGQRFGHGDETVRPQREVGGETARLRGLGARGLADGGPAEPAEVSPALPALAASWGLPADHSHAFHHQIVGDDGADLDDGADPLVAADAR
ncbi:MAG: hypothetical protein OER95_18345 [Acidimicrobiia bacterium]|nr:hypothetical protein [Acidimicrobiia bacterium]